MGVKRRICCHRLWSGSEKVAGVRRPIPLAADVWGPWNLPPPPPSLHFHLWFSGPARWEDAAARGAEPCPQTGRSDAVPLVPAPGPAATRPDRSKSFPTAAPAAARRVPEPRLNMAPQWMESLPVTEDASQRFAGADSGLLGEPGGEQGHSHQGAAERGRDPVRGLRPAHPLPTPCPRPGF